MEILRKCIMCGITATNDAELNLFTRHRLSAHGRSNRCKPCASKNNIARRTEIQHKVNTAKDVPCADCNTRYLSVCMDFNHRDRATKLWSIANGIRRGKHWPEIKQEIDKCDIVCSNCHRVRTWLTDTKYPRTKSVN